MMANWDKLNEEFDQLIDNMSVEDWMVWAANKESRKAMRRLEMELKAKLQMEKIFLSNRVGNQLFDNMVVCVDLSNNFTIDVPHTHANAGENNYALAA